MFSLKFQFATPCTIGYHFKSLFMLHPLYLTVPTCTGSHVMSEKKFAFYKNGCNIKQKKEDKKEAGTSAIVYLYI